MCRIAPSYDFKLSLGPDFHTRKPLFAGLDLRHRLPQHLHKGQEMEFLCQTQEVDQIQEIQITGRLGKGSGYLLILN